MKHASLLLPVILAVALAGCDEVPDLPPAPSPPAEPTAFDPANCGRITGRVTWAGPVPQAPPFLYGVPQPDGTVATRLVPNPNVPDVEPGSAVLRGAVVFLRGVDPARAKPWDLPPVRVELADRSIRVRQGNAPPRRVGFVRRGAPITMLSVEPVYHVLWARGDAYFSLTFPDPDQPLTRVLDTPGRVALSSGAGYYWASANLFVSDHPYFTLTDADGRFTLEQVPAGAAELVVWLPGWGVTRQDRDPETGLIFRQAYSPPIEVAVPLKVERGGETVTTLTLPANGR